MRRDLANPSTAVTSRDRCSRADGVPMLASLLVRGEGRTPDPATRPLVDRLSAI